MDKKLRCPRCNSSQTKCRIKTNDRICYTCGTVYKVQEEPEEEKSE